jgi:DNA-binding MarR family transcriptional regulator
MESVQASPKINEALAGLIQTVFVLQILQAWESGKYKPKSPLSDADQLALMLLKLSGESSMIERGIGGMLGLPSSSASDLVKRLLKLHVVSRNENKSEDTRAKPIALTPRGEQTIENIIKAKAEKLDFLLQGFSESEQKVLSGAIERIQETVLTRLRGILSGDNIPV